MNQGHLSLFFNLPLLLILVLFSCGKSDKNHLGQDDLSPETRVDSAEYMHVKNIIDKERENVRSSKVKPYRVQSLDSTFIPIVFVYEYHLDNDSLSADSFFQKVDASNIKHITKTIDRKPMKKPTHDENTIVFSENGDVIASRNETQPIYQIVRSINAYSSNFVVSRLMDIDHVDLHYSKYDVLYLSLGSSVTGDMNTQVYDYNSGELITSYQNNMFNGSYYIGNGISKDSNEVMTKLEKSEKLRVVIMIDDKFCIREFETKDIVEVGEK